MTTDKFEKARVLQNKIASVKDELKKAVRMKLTQIEFRNREDNSTPTTYYPKMRMSLADGLNSSDNITLVCDNNMCTQILTLYITKKESELLQLEQDFKEL